MTKNVLISYPKSGSNWIRYTIEFLTQKPTQGTVKRLIDGHSDINNIVLRRTHKKIKVNDNDCIIFLIRNPIELYLRKSVTNNNFEWDELYGLYDFFETNKSKNNVRLLYYEDLIKNFSVLSKLINNFYELDLVNNIDEFNDNIEYHRQNSLMIGNPYFSDSKDENYYKNNVKHDKQKIINKIKELGFDKMEILKRYKLTNL